MSQVVSSGPWPGLVTEGADALYNEQQVSQREESAWTPTVRGAITAGTCTYTTRSAYYALAGPLAYVCFNVAFTGHTGVGNVIITGCPLLKALIISQPYNLQHFQQVFNQGTVYRSSTGSTISATTYLPAVTIVFGTAYLFYRIGFMNDSSTPYDVENTMTLKGNLVFLNRLSKIE